MTTAGRMAMLVAAGLALAPVAAQARWRGGLFFGIGPLFAPPLYAPPAYYGPPIYAPPPPVYYGPPPMIYAPAPAGQGCYAGPYICPLDHPAPIGAACSCPTGQGRAYGHAG